MNWWLFSSSAIGGFLGAVLWYFVFARVLPWLEKNEKGKDE